MTATDAAETDTHQIDRPAWLPTEAWPFTIRGYRHHRPDRPPLDIHHTDEGKGPALVFVHAGLWSFVWRDAIKALDHDHRCITLDFPGAGLSRGEAADVDLTAYPDILNGLLDHLDVERATLVVHDVGGVVGVTAAGRRPERVAGLVAANAFAWPPDRMALKAMLAVMGSRLSTGVMGSLRVIPRLTRTRMGVGRHLDRADRGAFFGPYRSRPSSRNFHRAMRSARQSVRLFEEADEALRTSLADKPLFTVFGARNDQFGFADRWHSYLPDSTHWTVEGGHHFPMCDEPEMFSDQLRQWHLSCVRPA